MMEDTYNDNDNLVLGDKCHERSLNVVQVQGGCDCYKQNAEGESGRASQEEWLWG